MFDLKYLTETFVFWSLFSFSLLSALFLKFLFSQLWEVGARGGFGCVVSGFAFECHM